MSENELAAIRRRKLRELQTRAAALEIKNDKIDADKVLGSVFRGRAWEVFNAANVQFPEVMNKIKGALVKLVLSGKIHEIDGEQLYALLRSLNLRVRLKTEIRFLKHGATKSVADQIKQDF